jgi:hypothetical protein
MNEPDPRAPSMGNPRHLPTPGSQDPDGPGDRISMPRKQPPHGAPDGTHLDPDAGGPTPAADSQAASNPQGSDPAKRSD